MRRDVVKVCVVSYLMKQSTFSEMIENRVIFDTWSYVVVLAAEHEF